MSKIIMTNQQGQNFSKPTTLVGYCLQKFVFIKEGTGDRVIVRQDLLMHVGR